MSRSRSLATKTVAVAATVFLTAVGLSLGAGAANASTSASSVVASTLAQLASGRAAFLRNGFADEYADELNAAEVAGKGGPDPSTIPDLEDIAQPGYDGWGNEEYNFAGSLSSSTAAKIVAHMHAIAPLADKLADYNYAAVSVVASKGEIYVEVFLIDYPATPLDRIIAAAPTISGSAHVGVTLTASEKVTTPGIVPTFEWYLNGSGPVFSGPTFTPLGGALGGAVSVVSSLSASGYADLSLTSAGTKPLGLGTFTAHTPEITGSRNVNQTLTANDAGVWGPGDPDIEYSWYINGKATDVVGPVYTIQHADKGKTINVKVTASEGGFTTLSKSSKSTTKVGNPFLSSSVPVISGDVTVGNTLTAADGGDWGPGSVTRSWQWSVNGKKVSGATKNTFTIPKSAYSASGSSITVTETGSGSGYAATSATSDPTDTVVGLNFGIVGARGYSGTAAVGNTIKAVLPTFTPKPTMIKYKWIIDGVTKSTSSSYKIPASASGKTITLQVTASKSGYVLDTNTDDIAVPSAG